MKIQLKPLLILSMPCAVNDTWSCKVYSKKKIKKLNPDVFSNSLCLATVEELFFVWIKFSNSIQKTLISQ